MPGFGALMVIDREGRLVAAAPGTPPRRASLADRDYFQVHKGSSGIGLFVSKPFVSRLSGHWVVVLSRRLEDGNRAFDGVVLASVDLAYLSKLSAGLDVGPDRAVTLFRTDGTVIAREPTVDAAAHVWVGGEDAFTAMRSSRVGTFEGASPIDGRRRIMSFHRVGDLPMIQVVEAGGEDAYAAWWRRAAVVGALLAILCLSVLALCFALDRALRQRAATEETLARLAATDALTGLTNRRSFDVALSQVWSDAAETGAAVAVMMIDADAFKSYNDLFGHHAGDDVLRRVAGCLDAIASELGGITCRWGGEEFAVLLPGHEETDALLGAETVCRAVRSLGIINPSGVGGRVTVSVGVASVRPALGGSSKESMADAEKALYRAKRDGRNRGAGSFPPLTVSPASHDERRLASA